MDRTASVPVGPGSKMFDDFCRYDSDPLDILEGRTVRSPQSEAAVNPTRYRSVSRKSFGSLYRASRSVAGDLWRNSAVSDSVSDIHGFDNLRQLCGPDQEVFVDCDDLNFVKVVGQGAFAEVSIADYQGPYASVPPQVAVKRLKLDTTSNENDVLDFIAEVRILHRLNHPNIVKFVGFGCLDNSSREAEWRTIFLVQEYMKGGTIKAAILKQMINRPKIIYTFSVGLRWCLDAARALNAMHKSSPMVIHRDLKSENILLTSNEPDCVAKVGDFGLHVVVDRPRKSSKSGIHSVHLKQTKSYEMVTKTGAMKSPFMNAPMPDVDEEREEATTFWKMTGKTGAYCYMSPEVLHGKPYNERVDVFSFGVVLYEVIAKRLLVADYMNTDKWDESETHAERVAAGWRPPFPMHMPESIRKLVDKCWAGIPELRPSMEEVVKQLEEIQRSGVIGEMDAKETKSAGCGCSVM